MMKKKYLGTKTGENLSKAVEDEAMSYIKYKWMIAESVEEMYPPLENFFMKIAKNEKEHCEVWAEELYEKATMEDINHAIQGEINEGIGVYSDYAKTAREEGFPELAKKFEMAAGVERSHALMLNDVMKMMKEGKVFKTDEPMCWTCMECGNRLQGTVPPVVCPLCGHKNTYITKTPLESII